VLYVCIFTNTSSAAVWSASATITTASVTYSASAAQYTALPGTYFVAYEQTGGTAATLESYNTSLAFNAILDVNGTSSNYRVATAANGISAGACPSSLGSLTVLDANNNGDVAILLEP
jgi:hypothetical protein